MALVTQYDLTDYLLKKANLARLGSNGYTLVILSTYVNTEWKCWPSMDTLAERTGANRKTIQRHINYLVESGLITRTKSPVGATGFIHNVYTFNIANILEGGAEL